MALPDPVSITFQSCITETGGDRYHTRSRHGYNTRSQSKQLQLDTRHGEEQVTFIVEEEYPLMALSFGHEGEHTVPAFTDSDSIHAFIAHEGYEQYTVPRNDEQSKNTPDAEQWALARAEELASCLGS